MLSDPKPARATLFLGAGASATFGFPTTKGFFDNLAKILTGDLELFFNSFSMTPGITDIEHILEILDQVVELENPIPLLRYFAHWQVKVPVLGGQATWSEFRKRSGLLRAKIRDRLYVEYGFSTTKRPAVREILEQTLNTICKGDHNIMHLFTTNYDSVVEEGLSTSQTYAYRDGFDQRYGQPALWNTANFNVPAFPNLEPPKPKLVYLYKLHGSLKWRTEKETGLIVRVETEERSPEDSKRYGENILLYPASKLPPIDEPYGTLHNYFVERLNTAEKCIVIGFSFRDPYINTVFVNYLRASRKNRIYVISPTSNEAMKSLLGTLQDGPLADQVEPYDNRFGDPYTRSLIEARMIDRD